MRTTDVNRITLEMVGLSAGNLKCWRHETDEWYEYPGYYRSKAHCQLDIFTSEDKSTVAIVTELKKNEGLSVTNAIEKIAAQLCKERNLKPENLILIEHYDADCILDERYSLVRFKKDRQVEGLWFLEEPDWIPLDKAEINRLTHESGFFDLDADIPNE